MLYLLSLFVFFTTSKGGIPSECDHITETDLQKQVWATTDPTRDINYIEAMFPDLINQNNEIESNTCGTRVGKYFTDGCVQLHIIDTTDHPDGGLDPYKVEMQFNYKWDHLIENIDRLLINSDDDVDILYDSFLDYNMKIYVHDLETFDTLWDSAEDLTIDRVYLTWNVDIDGVSTQFYSMIALMGGSQVIFELISDTFTDIDTKDYLVQESEPRASFSQVKPWEISTWDDMTYYHIGVSRSVENLDDNVEFYTNIMQGTVGLTDKTNLYFGQNINYAHITLTRNIEVSLYERKKDTNKVTYGSYSVKSFQDDLQMAHNNVMVGPLCGMDKWLDNHYGIYPIGDETEDIVNALQFSGKYKYVNYLTREEGNYFIYVAEPNGQGTIIINDVTDYNVIDDLSGEWAIDWCQIDCTEDQLEYNWGDQIFYFDDNSKKQSISKLRSKKGSIIILFLILITFVSAFIAYIYKFMKNKSKTIKLPTSNGKYGTLNNISINETQNLI